MRTLNAPLSRPCTVIDRSTIAPPAACLSCTVPDRLAVNAWLSEADDRADDPEDDDPPDDEADGGTEAGVRASNELGVPARRAHPCWSGPARVKMARPIGVITASAVA